MRPTSIRSRRLITLAASATLALALAGCSTPEPRAGTDTGTGPLVTDSDLSAARDAYDLEMAQCLRDKGFDIKDPAPGEGIQEYSDAIWAGMGECTDLIGDPPVSDVPFDDAARLESALIWADCFRDLGYEVVEPKLGEAFAAPEKSTEQDMNTCFALAP